MGSVFSQSEGECVVRRTHEVASGNREGLAKCADSLDIPLLDHAGQVPVELWRCKVPDGSHLELGIVLEEAIEALNANTTFEADDLCAVASATAPLAVPDHIDRHLLDP